jgi:hypothetical protein
VLIAHGAIEATLRNIVAGGFEIHVAELLIHVVLRSDQRLRRWQDKSRDGDPE